MAKLKSIEASELNSWGYKKKVVSGMHTESDKDVMQQVLWPHKALNSNWNIKKPEYYNLAPVQFDAGAIAAVLFYMPSELTESSTCCMLRHLNRIFTYAETYTWKACLTLHANFLAQWEQRKKDWSSWSSVLDWHKLQMENMLAFKKDKKSDLKENGDSKDSPKGNNNKIVCGVERSQIKASHLCSRITHGV